MNPQFQLMLQQAIQAFQSGNFISADLILKRVLQVDSKNLPALHVLGLVKASQANYKEAIDFLKRAARIQPNDASIQYNLAKALADSGNDKDALAHHKKAVALAPNNPEAWLSYGKTASNLDRYEDALIWYGNALSLKPDYAEAALNKGATLKELKRYDEAIAHYDKALSLKPDYAEAWSNKGITLNELKRYDEAIAHYDKALSLKPGYAEAWSNKALLNLFLKNYQAGWENYNWRLKTKDLQLRMPIEGLALWNGSNCQHLLIYSEQGVGDIIFYSSILENLKNKAINVTVSTDRRLLPILSRSFPEITFIDSNAPLNASLYDALIPFGSLAAVLNMDPRMSGRSVPYLVDNDRLTKNLKNITGTKNTLKCGVAWKSNNLKLGENKSILLSDLNSVFTLQDYEFINLQYGDTQEEEEILEKNYDVKLSTIEGIDLFENIDGLLSIIKTCDVIVTTSNVTAHLAGALGKKTLLLAPYMPGRIWYWHEESVSSWYPSISIYSQDKNFEWNDALQNIVSRLKNGTF